MTDNGVGSCHSIDPIAKAAFGPIADWRLPMFGSAKADIIGLFALKASNDLIAIFKVIAVYLTTSSQHQNQLTDRR